MGRWLSSVKAPGWQSGDPVFKEPFLFLKKKTFAKIKNTFATA
jgi:hypothetical protein